jgi:histone H3/H4
MPKQHFIKDTAVKNYIKEILKFRSAQNALDEFIEVLNVLIETIMREAKTIAQIAKRCTIMKKDITAALEKHVGKRHLTWEETAEEIIRQNPADLGKISKAINDYIDKHSDNK